MSTLPTVALAGATGNLGPVILKALLDAQFQVTVLTRSENSKLGQHPNQTIKVVDYASQSSLVSALKGIDVVVSTLSISSADAQKNLIGASLEAGVSRFLPSEFGSDPSLPGSQTLPVFKVKYEARQQLQQIVAENPQFTYTYVVTGPFYDWCIQYGVIVNPREHSATIYDGGDVPFSVTRLATVGQTVVAVLKNLDLTKNQQVCVHEGTTTQNKVIAAIKQADGQEWKTETKNTKDLLAWANSELVRPGGDLMAAFFSYILVAIFSEEDIYGRNLSGSLWNDKLGIKLLSEEEMAQAAVQAAKSV